MTNLLPDTSGNLTFSQYILSDFWSGGVDADGIPVLTASVSTHLGVPYELDFSLAANLSANVESVQVEILFDGETIGSFVHDGANFARDSGRTNILTMLAFKVRDRCMMCLSLSF